LHAQTIGGLAAFLSLSPLALGCGGTAGSHPGTAAYPQPSFAPAAHDRGASLPDPAAGGEVALEELLAWAHEHAPAIRVARARARRGDAEIEAASPILQDNPEVGVGVGGRTIASSTFVELEVSLQQTIEIAGERGLRIETAERGRDVALAEQDEARWRAHVEVHALFLDALVARERVAAAVQVVRFAEELEQIAQRRVDAGDDAPLSTLVARADLAQARELLVAAQQDEDAIRTTLAEVSGWPVSLPVRPRGTLPPIRMTRALPDLVRLAARHHPALRTQALAVAEAESRVRLEDRDAWPEPTLGAAYASEGDASQVPHVWLFTAGIPIPLWNRNQGGRARASVALDTARAEQEILGERLQAQLARAATRVNAAAQRVQILGEDVVPAVERNLELIRRAYDLGELDVHAVSQTRERVLDVQARALGALGEYVRALTDLEALVGTELGDSALQETTP